MHPRRMIGLAALLALAVPAAARSEAGDPVPPPALLSQTGLYADMASLRVDPANRPFAPQYALWTDGAAKGRWVHLPEGTIIDASDLDAWRFPVGTKFWKEFSFNGRRVETRLIWRAAEDRWIFAAYVWNEEETEAHLAPESGVPGHVEIAPGKRHAIPSIADCGACHAAGPTPVLGFSALQLSDDRDLMAPHAEPLPAGAVTLRTLIEEGRLVPARRDLVDHPPRIAASSPRERAALGYLSANCGHCHNASGPLARLDLVLAHEVTSGSAALAAAIARAADAPGRYKVPGVAEEESRLLAPGDPSRSAVAHRMRSRRPSSQMPPLGTVVCDEEGSRLIEEWITLDLVPSRAASRRASLAPTALIPGVEPGDEGQP